MSRSRDSRVDMRHDLQYYYDCITWQGTLLTKNKEKCTTQQILTTTTQQQMKAWKTVNLNLTAEWQLLHGQCDKCMSLEVETRIKMSPEKGD